jgi:hypothetical protein
LNDFTDFTDSAYFTDRPPCRASSYGSVDSGVSHPPRAGNKGKKVVNMSYTEFAKQATDKPTERNQSSYVKSYGVLPYEPSLELENPTRDHPLYQNVIVHADGLYHCPFEKDPNFNCQHKPEKLKCNCEYDKINLFSQ